mmetsp:Transcript_99344/g.315329  ORF Transcript_99344/g.315329 Transcript_99344/m.315329 type:complete len:333 (-) Transcript_99344:213-1211(-)
MLTGEGSQSSAPGSDGSSSVMKKHSTGASSDWVLGSGWWSPRDDDGLCALGSAAAAAAAAASSSRGVTLWGVGPPSDVPSKKVQVAAAARNELAPRPAAAPCPALDASVAPRGWGGMAAFCGGNSSSSASAFSEVFSRLGESLSQRSRESSTSLASTELPPSMKAEAEDSSNPGSAACCCASEAARAPAESCLVAGPAVVLAASASCSGGGAAFNGKISSSCSKAQSGPFSGGSCSVPGFSPSSEGSSGPLTGSSAEGGAEAGSAPPASASAGAGEAGSAAGGACSGGSASLNSSHLPTSAGRAAAQQASSGGLPASMAMARSPSAAGLNCA